MWLLQSAVFLCFLFTQVIGNEEILVNIDQGTLKGVKTLTVTRNIPYYSFKGIPFAKPMIGLNKFDPPQPPEPWSEIWDATEHRAKCPYWCIMENGVMGDVDCLHLNVYTPTLNELAKKAVLVWFPAGGFNAGAGNDDMHGPDFLIDQDVILVTPNYRIGAIGFLSTLDENAPGNVGMKDQVMALRWVQQNIHHFGGDPSRITIFGHSSGSASVQLHMISPMSQGLFKGGIMQSGAAVAEWSINRSPKEAAFSLGKKLGINAKTTKDLVDGLKKKSHEDIIIATKEVNKEMNAMCGQLYAFVPVVEMDVGQEVFLPNDPWILLKSGNLVDVPLMIGITVDEGALLLPLMKGMLDMFNKHLDKAIPTSLNMTDPAKRKATADNLRKFYFNNKQIVLPDNEAEFIMFIGDIIYNMHPLISAKIMESRNKSPVYKYLFTYEAPFGIMKNLGGMEKYVAHGDETGYQFYSTAFKNKPEPNSPAQSIINKMTKMWTNFAKEGNPTSRMDSDVNIQWLPTGKEDNYLNINLELKMEKGLYSDRVSLWADMYKDILGDYAAIVT